MVLENFRRVKQRTRSDPVLPASDMALVQIVDAALADAAYRSGDWLACKPGCHQCCVGVFAISTLDAERLRAGLRMLSKTDAERTDRVLARAAGARERLLGDFPGDAHTGALGEDEDAQECFAEFANDEPCPVLDPASGTCDLYASRPMTCRVFGPPVRSGDGLGVCELCFQGATPEEIQAGEMHLPPTQLEEDLTKPLGAERTIIAFALCEGAGDRA